MAERVTARIFNGTRDILPEEMIPRRKMLEVIVDIFQKYGFAPLETPVMEYMDVLTAKAGEESLNLIYPLAYKGGELVGLKFDLTVPLARFVAMNPQLPLPFKRWQVQPVYRAERAQPKQGRYREFYQCDVDTVGTSSLVADAENLAVCYEVFEALGVGHEGAGLVMRVNHRKVLRGIVEASGLPASMDQVVCSALDKIDKIGREKVEEVLGEAGVNDGARATLFELVGLGEQIGMTRHDELIAALEERLAGTESGPIALAEMRELLSAAQSLGVPADILHFDLILTRGLDYYTGPIYEFAGTKLGKFGSLGGGGRYDGLVSIYSGRDVPGTGVCIGLSRLQQAMSKLGLIESRSSPTMALVLRLADSDLSDDLALVSRLREGGVPAELYYEPVKFGKQITYAERKGIPFVVIQGTKELELGVAQLKDIRVGEQVEVAVADLAARILADQA